MSPEEWLKANPQYAADAPQAVAAPMSPEEWLAANPKYAAEPETTTAGLAGAATRGFAPVAAGALAGAALGAPIGGVGAIPGAAAGAAAAGLTQLVGDPVVASINSLFGTKYTLPTDALNDLLTRVGVPEPKTAAERIVQTTAAGIGGGASGVALGQSLARQTSPLMQGIGQSMAAKAPAQIVGGGTAGISSQSAAELGAGPLGQIAAGLAGGIGGGLAASRPSIQRIPAATASVVKAIPKAAVRMAKGEPSQTIAAATEGIKTDPYNADFAGYKIPTTGVTAVVDDAAKETIRQGWRPKFIAALKASSPEDYSAARKMLNLWELGAKRANIDKRPTDIVGDTMLTRINYIGGVKNQAGKELETAADALRGKSVNFSPAMDSFIGRLQKMGVSVGQNVENPDFTVGDMRVSLRGSDIEGDEGSVRLLQSVFKRLSTDAPDGYGVHTAKRWLDNQIEYGKKSKTGLLGDTERAVKSLRHDLNQSLRDYSPEYAKANTKYADTIKALESLKDSIGSKIDIEGVNADKALGTEARKLLSNYQARVNMLTAIDGIETVAKKYGMKINDSISNQIIVANEIDRMFGAVAEGSFKGQIEQALTTGVKAARGNITGVALDLAGGAIDKARGINEKNAVAALRRLLDEKHTTNMGETKSLVTK